MKLSFSILSFAFLLSSVNANMMGCVTDFEEGKDYFPDKVEVEFSEHWSILYAKTYKVLRNSDSGTNYLLYQCGTEMPPQSLIDEATAVVPVPLPNFGLHYTTFIPYVELLGQRTNIAAMAGQASWVYSPCLKQMIDDNMVTMVSVLNNETLLGEINVDKALPYFVGVGTDNVFDDAFQISEWKETSLLGIFEWIKFFSVFFNKEKEANEIFDQTHDRIECARENANVLATDSAKPVVLWGTYSDYCGGWDVARSCPNYYCELANTCDATLLTSMEGSVDAYDNCYRNYMTTEEFVAFGKDADLWIYAGHDGDFGATLAQYPELQEFTSVKNNKVYDVSGQTLDAWFSIRKTEPDTLIQDFCSVVGREDPSSPFPHDLTFLRHIDDAIASPAVCTSIDSPFDKLGSECVRMPGAVPVNDAPDEEEGGGFSLCFSGLSTVNLEDGSKIKMRDLKIGDRVQVTENGKFDTVDSFGHYKPDSVSEYLSIQSTANAAPITISAPHMIFLDSKKAVPASSIKVGDILLGGNTVKKVEKVTLKGAFAPFTPSGTIVVNDVVASNYVSLTGTSTYLSIEMQTIAHSAVSARRMLCQLSSCAENYNEEGIASWIPYQAAMWVASHEASIALLTIALGAISLARVRRGSKTL